MVSGRLVVVSIGIYSEHPAPKLATLASSSLLQVPLPFTAFPPFLASLQHIGIRLKLGGFEAPVTLALPWHFQPMIRVEYLPIKVITRMHVSV